MTLSSISSSVPPIGYGDPLQFTANELKNTLDTKAWEFHQQALSKRTKFANSKFGTLLSRPAHTQKQLTQLASMYEDLSHALDITIQQDKRTEIPKAWRAGDIHNRLWGFHDDRRKYMYEVPSCKGSRDTDNDLKEVDHRFVEVCSEALAYLAAPQQNGIAPSVCSTKASEWGQIGATRGYDTMFAGDKDRKTNIQKDPWAGPGTCGFVSPTDRDWESDATLQATSRCRCWETVKRGIEIGPGGPTVSSTIQASAYRAVH